MEFSRLYPVSGVPTAASGLIGWSHGNQVTLTMNIGPNKGSSVASDLPVSIAPQDCEP